MVVGTIFGQLPLMIMRNAVAFYHDQTHHHRRYARLGILPPLGPPVCGEQQVDAPAAVAPLIRFPMIADTSTRNHAESWPEAPP
jgi:hypothetical protein